MSRRIELRAPAKVNLTLEVLGRHADGYHELRSVFAILDLADRLVVSGARRLDVRVRPDPGCRAEDELSARAVLALASATGRRPWAHVRVAKRIPVAAGLGGGSSDAGATLRATAALWRSDADLVPVAATIGSDVPFFATGAAFALVEGRGERVTALPVPPAPPWVVLVRVPARLRTTDVFAALRPDERSDGSASARLAAAFRDATADAEVLRACGRNDLTAAAARICPEVAEARSIAGWQGITLAVSGSGPSLFAIANDRADALRLARILRAKGLAARAHALGAAGS